MKDKSSKMKAVEFVKMNSLTLLTMLGVVLGVISAVIIRIYHPEPMAKRTIMYISFPGELFLRMLKGIILPLVIPSLVLSVGVLDLSLSRKIGGRAIAYYITTTILAVIIGIILVTVIQPGTSPESKISEKRGESRNVTTADTLMDLIRNLFPSNIIEAATVQHRTVLIPPTDPNMTDKYSWDFEVMKGDNPNILGLIVFSIVTGLSIAIIGEEGRPLLKFFESLSSVMMLITVWIIHLAPIGVFFIIIGKVLTMDNFGDSFKQLGMYFITVLVGLTIHGFIVLPLIYIILVRESPISFILNMGSALMTAFGTSSSSATLPVTMNSLEEKNHIDKRISRFILPIGATINMDGTALYEAVAAIFIAQVRNVELSIGQLVAVSITATAASVGAAGIPSAGIVTMVMVLDTVGLPSEDVGLILALDWLLDRCRTTINVLGDSLGAAIVYHLSKKELDHISPKKKSEDSTHHETTFM